LDDDILSPLPSQFDDETEQTQLFNAATLSDLFHLDRSFCAVAPAAAANNDDGIWRSWSS
jgi:hypothetical protein